MQVPFNELNNRIKKFRARMDIVSPDWKIAVIFSKINQYYFTGTMQDGMLIIPRYDEATYWVRRTYERALEESLFPSIKPMNSFRDAKNTINILPDTVYLETESVPLALYQRFHKHFPFKEVKPADQCIAYIRSIKSPYEVSIMEQCGKIHQRILETRVPDILVEGMSEAELSTKLFTIMIEEGHHGLSRLNMYDTEIILGNIAFGENSNYPSYFNGPGGNKGLSPAVPLMGSRERLLKKGDLVFIDIGCGYEGYHTDKTMTYMFGGTLSDNALLAHEECVCIEKAIASMLKPGNIPSRIYNDVMSGLSSDFKENFMGYGSRKVKFLGHSLGLVIDELPVIAEGFDNPIEDGMFFAIEPKKGIDNIGMVGIENTYRVSAQGGILITGNNPGLISVPAG